jgi:hypothetical protein
MGALLAFSSAALCCAVLGIYILAEDKTTKAGIATLIVRTYPSYNTFCFTNKSLTQFNFNLTGIHLPDPLIKSRTIPARGLLQSFQSEAQSATSLLNTAISGVSSEAAGAVATAVSDITAIEAMIPRNCSLGTKQFCVGFENNTKCNDLPLNISNIVPEAVTKFVGNEIQSLQPLEGILAKVTPANIYLIVGLIFILVIILIFTCLFFELISFGALLLKLGACLMSVLCLGLFLFLYLIIRHVQSKVQDFKSVVGIVEGPVGHLTMGALICAGVMMLLTIGISTFM